MTLMTEKQKAGNLSALVLRLTVAGILTAAATGNLTPPPIFEADQPVPIEAIPEAVAFDQEVSQPLAQALHESVPEGAALDQSGLKVDLGWWKLIGLGEIGFGAMLLAGLLTRWAALAGISTVTLSALSAHGRLAWSIPEEFAQAYQSSPVAALLLGAICLSLLVSGSGPMGIDGILRLRRARRRAVPDAIE